MRQGQTHRSRMRVLWERATRKSQASIKSQTGVIAKKIKILGGFGGSDTFARDTFAPMFLT